ncbi:hypothetical protein D3C86_2009580 [compost metagenome]
MDFGLGAVLFESGLEVFRRRGLGHLRQGLEDMPFGEIDVLESVEEQIFKGLFGLGSHLRSRCCDRWRLNVACKATVPVG